LELRALLGKGFAWAINGAAGLQQQPLFEVEQNETIILAFDNRTNFNQPVAIDGHVWRPLSATGEQAEDQSWGDTAVIPPKAKASYVFRAINPGLWTLTSLIAERADAGLIGSFMVKSGP
jgi:FtsP/CotA-like multicopper oxidase with cupredoxin domain